MTSTVLFPIVGIATAVVLVAAVRRYHDTEQQSLVWLLTTAAERGVPLDVAARCFAEERGDLVGTRAARLAEYLEAGVPLSLALRRSGIRMSTAAELAADLGTQTGTLGPALRQAINHAEEYEISLRSLVEKSYYIAWMLFFGSATLAFMVIKIAPVYDKMFQEFAIPLPSVTISLLAMTRWCMEYWPFVAGVLVVLLLLFVEGVFFYTGCSVRHLPMIRRFWRRVDCALVMRWLAMAARQDRPFAEFLRLLASYLPQPALRSQLAWAASRLEQGTHWCETLQRAKVLRSHECAVFRAAERAGNLAWALEEMADGSLRRSVRRTRLWLSLAIPAVVLTFGGCVLFFAAAFLLPLAKLIEWLT
jgi:type II secretory pathway component PulF